jgi:hypothetical protein
MLSRRCYAARVGLAFSARKGHKHCRGAASRPAGRRIAAPQPPGRLGVVASTRTDASPHTRRRSRPHRAAPSPLADRPVQAQDLRRPGILSQRARSPPRGGSRKRRRIASDRTRAPGFTSPTICALGPSIRPDPDAGRGRRTLGNDRARVKEAAGARKCADLCGAVRFLVFCVCR